MMTETLDVVSAATPPRKRRPARSAKDVERDAVRALVQAAWERGEDLTGPDGLLRQLTKSVLETALDEEMSERLGYDKHDLVGNNTGNSRNGMRTKTVFALRWRVHIGRRTDVHRE
jgi:putative transposase